MGKIIGIVSGKGGVGKTTVCSGLAFALASQGKKVIAIDGDIGLKNLDILLGMSDGTAYDLTDILANRCQISKAVQIHPNFSNLHFISASQTASAEDMEAHAFANLCRYLRGFYEFVLIDAPAGLGHGFKNIIGCCDECIVVATSDLTSIRDAQKTSAYVSSVEGLTPYLLLNKINPQMISRGYLQNIDDIIDSVSLPLIGMLPCDDKLVVYSNRGVPLTSTKSICARPMMNIASRLAGVSVPLDKYFRKK